MQEFRVSPQMIVTFTYAISDDHGKVVEQSDLPVNYIHAVDGKMFPKVEQAMEGAAVGDEIVVKLSPQEGFGEHDAALTYSESVKNVPAEYQQVGTEATFKNDSGETLTMTVTRVENGQVILDGNHPFAGKDMTFSIKVIEIRPAMAEEIMSGTVMDEKGSQSLH